MTPVEFDHLYFEYAQALAAAEPGLLRDRLILLLLQRVDVAIALEDIGAAAAIPTLPELKRDSHIEPPITANH